MEPGQETNGDIYGNVFDLQQNHAMLRVLIRMPRRGDSNEYT